MIEKFKEIKVFLSCTEEIVADGFPNGIEDVIQQSNEIFCLCGLKLELRHWKKEIYLGRGEPRVQDRINRHLLSNCDIFIGILWTRFGSPPGINQEDKSYSSGTEEEFYEAKKSNKQIWIFFYDGMIKPSLIDISQLEKVRKFRDILKKEQIEFGDFNLKEEFYKQLRSNFKAWVNDKYSIEVKEKPEAKISIPKKEEFEKLTRGF